MDFKKQAEKLVQNVAQAAEKAHGAGEGQAGSDETADRTETTAESHWKRC